MPSEKQLDQIAEDAAYFFCEFPKALGALTVLPFYLAARTWRRVRGTR